MFPKRRTEAKSFQIGGVPTSYGDSIAQIEATTVAAGNNGSGFGGLTIGPNTWSTGVYTGVFWQRSETSLRMIGDGTSKVYMLGEKYMGLFDATLGATGSGDEENIYVGMDDDNIRLTANGGITKSTLAPNKNIMCPTCYVPPQQDAAVWAFNETTLAAGAGAVAPGKPGGLDYFNSVRFGSSHASAFNMAFCDGSVHSITYEINYLTHIQLSNRNDGQTIFDPSAYLDE